MNRSDQIAESITQYIDGNDYGVTVDVERIKDRPKLDRTEIATDTFKVFVFPSERRKDGASRGSGGRGTVTVEYDTRIFVATRLSDTIDAEDGRDLAEMISDSLDFQNMADAGWQATETLLLTSLEELDDGLFVHVIQTTHLEVVGRTTYTPTSGLMWEDGTGFIYG